MLQGVIRHADVASLAVFCTGDMEANHNARKIRNQVCMEAEKLANEFDASTQIDLRRADAACDIRLIPGIMLSALGKASTWAQLESAL
eukprot:1147992-Pyramimonas_sp.AAC.1